MTEQPVGRGNKMAGSREARKTVEFQMRPEHSLNYLVVFCIPCFNENRFAGDY